MEADEASWFEENSRVDEESEYQHVDRGGVLPKAIFQSRRGNRDENKNEKTAKRCDEWRAGSSSKSNFKRRCTGGGEHGPVTHTSHSPP